jgi:hypothetical protein
MACSNYCCCPAYYCCYTPYYWCYPYYNWCYPLDFWCCRDYYYCYPHYYSHLVCASPLSPASGSTPMKRPAEPASTTTFDLLSMLDRISGRDLYSVLNISSCLNQEIRRLFLFKCQIIATGYPYFGAEFSTLNTEAVLSTLNTGGVLSTLNTWGSVINTQYRGNVINTQYRAVLSTLNTWGSVIR